MGPDPAVAAVRLGVRRSLKVLADRAAAPDAALVLVACSGGSDSLALAAALAFEAPRLGLRAGGITVDHGLQPGSAEQASRVAATLRGLGLDPVACVRAAVTARGGGGTYPGPEAAARRARYAAIEAAAVEYGATAVLLGHTLDDQAETVLLGLARGSGARSLAGMRAASGCYLRPLLGLRRAQTIAACAAQGLEPWEDPQNADPAFARTRVRQQILPLMEELLGPGIAEALARTADALRADADALDALAREAEERLGGADGGLEVTALAELPAAIRSRLLRRAAIAAGAPAGSLGASHIAQLDALVTGWRGQRGADLPGGLRCVRRYGRLQFTTPR
jgi:tRNA(Ile)-lysidine synthase